MFVPRYFFEKFLSLLEAQHALGQRQTEDSWQRVLTAKDSEVAAVIAAKDQQITFLTAALEEQRGLVAHERQRAEAAVDILLTRDAEAGPIRNADLIRAQAEREALGPEIPRPQKDGDALKRVFDQMSDVLGGADDEGLGLLKDEKLEMAGGRV